MTSLWHETAPVIASDKFDGVRCDVVVVGAGLTGLVTALMLARAGKSVTVLEARHAGAVTTGNTTGKLSLLQGTTLSSLHRFAGDEAVQAYAAANREGQRWLVNELETQGEAVEWRTAYTYASTGAQLDDLKLEAEASAIAGIAVNEISDAGLPFQTFGALSLEHQVQLQPMTVLAMLAKQLRAFASKLVERCRVIDIEQENDHLRIVSSKGQMIADQCVLATGVPILDRGLFFAKVLPTRSFVAAYRVADENVIDGMYVSAGKPFRSLRTATDREGSELLVVGGAAQPVGRFENTSDEIRQLDSWAALHFTKPQQHCWWAAQDYRTHSRIPYAGEMPRTGSRVFTATGYNKWGMTNGVAAAVAMSSQMLGKEIEWSRNLNEHCLRLSGVREALGVNAAVAGHLVSGWASAELKSVDSVDRLKDGEGVVARQGATPVAMSNVGGKVCRVSGVCTHMGGILRWNDAERSWDCPLHGSRFSSDGTLLEGPATQDLPGAEA